MAEKKRTDVVQAEDMTAAQRDHLFGELHTSFAFAEDDPPPQETLDEIAAELLATEPFAEVPLTGAGQVGYLERLHEAVVMRLARPSPPPDVSAYVDAGIVLPEVPQGYGKDAGDIAAERGHPLAAEVDDADE